MPNEDTQAILAAIAKLGGDVTQMRSDMTQMRVDIMERIDRLQHVVDLVRDDLTVNFSHADRVERIAQATRDEGRLLAETVRVMQRQIKMLQTDVEQLRGGGAAA